MNLSIFDEVRRSETNTGWDGTRRRQQKTGRHEDWPTGKMENLFGRDLMRVLVTVKGRERTFVVATIGKSSWISLFSRQHTFEWVLKSFLFFIRFQSIFFKSEVKLKPVKVCRGRGAAETTGELCVGRGNCCDVVNGENSCNFQGYLTFFD